MKIKILISGIIATLIMLSFFIIKTVVLFDYMEHTKMIEWYEYLSVILFMPPFFIITKEFINIINKGNTHRKSTEELLNDSALISKADNKGKIIYVNDKFCEVSGYKAHELLGKDHSVLNSGKQPKEFWTQMYIATVKYKSIWNEIVVNKDKKGDEYIVDSWIKAEFDQNDKLTGYISVRHDISELIKQKQEIEKNNAYLEHAAKILRHDMHSGINTYIPRGLNSLKRRLTEDKIKELNIEAPIKLLEEGLSHAQKVYAGVKEFTNLVKKDAILDKKPIQLSSVLKNYLKSTAYAGQVDIDELGIINANEALICTAIDNLIRNGLKYNDNSSKIVRIYKEEDNMIVVEDNGRGMTQEQFENYSKPYVRNNDNKESGTGLGLNICIAIIKEHGFSIGCELSENGGSKIKIKI